MKNIVENQDIKTDKAEIEGLRNQLAAVVAERDALAAEGAHVRERYRFIRALGVSILEHSGGRHDWRGAMEDATDLVKTIDDAFAESPATAAAIAAIEAQGVEKFAKRCRDLSTQESRDVYVHWELAGDRALKFAAELRGHSQEVERG